MIVPFLPQSSTNKELDQSQRRRGSAKAGRQAATRYEYHITRIIAHLAAMPNLFEVGASSVPMASGYKVHSNIIDIQSASILEISRNVQSKNVIYSYRKFTLDHDNGTGYYFNSSCQDCAKFGS